MLRKLTTNILILLLAAIPLAITLTNYKLNYDPSIVDITINDPKILISDIASQITFLSISVCIIALADYWDFRSEDRPDQHKMQEFVKIQYAIVFLLTTVILTNFILYYAEILSVTVAEFRWKKSSEDAAASEVLVSSLSHAATKFLACSSALLLSSVLLYGAYFLTQTEQKLMSRVFWSYSR